MKTKKEELLATLTQECELYSSIPESEQQQKRDKKYFINGLMTACRIVGVSFDELDSIIKSMPKQSKFKNLDEQLSIPTYVRNNIKLQDLTTRLTRR